jgi:phosphate:Na+ symporter
MVDGIQTYPNTVAAIAATHTIFNVANTILFIAFVPQMAKLLVWLVPSRGFEEKPRLTDLDIRMLETPLLAIEQSRKEILKMAAGCSKMLGWLAEIVQQDEPDKELADRLRNREKILDAAQDEIAEFVTKLLSGNISHATAEEARQQFRYADEYESISDYIVDLDNFDRKLRRDGFRFSEEQRTALLELNQHVAEHLASVNEALRTGNRSVITQTDATNKRIRNEIKSLRRKHLEDLSAGNTPPLVSVAYLASLNAYARVRDHAVNVAETIAEEHKH